MGKKDKVQNNINIWHSYLNKTISVLIALFAFVFSATGKLLKAPFWLIIVSIVGLVIGGFVFIFIQKKLTKLLKEIGDLK